MGNESDRRHRLPTMVGGEENVEAGTLMSYGADRNDLVRPAASYIDKILKVREPARRPTKSTSQFEACVQSSADSGMKPPTIPE